VTEARQFDQHTRDATRASPARCDYEGRYDFSFLGHFCGGHCPRKRLGSLRRSDPVDRFRWHRRKHQLRGRKRPQRSPSRSNSGARRPAT